MINFDDYVNGIASNENKTKHNDADINKIYLCPKDPFEAKYQYLVNKREGVGIDHFNDPKAFIEYSNDMRDVMNY